MASLLCDMVVGAHPSPPPLTWDPTALHGLCSSSIFVFIEPITPSGPLQRGENIRKRNKQDCLGKQALKSLQLHKDIIDSDNWYHVSVRETGDLWPRTKELLLRNPQKKSFSCSVHLEPQNGYPPECGCWECVSYIPAHEYFTVGSCDANGSIWLSEPAGSF